MVLSQDSSSSHPYTYGRVIGLFHVDIAYTGPGLIAHHMQRLDVVWVRWFQVEPNSSQYFIKKRLPQVKFIHYSDPSAFGFLDPELIIRGVHIIPSFAQGQTNKLLPASLVRFPTESDKDYEWYYVNM